MRLTLFHTENGMLSGPGANEEEDFITMYLFSSLVWGSAEGSRDRLPIAGMRSFGGKR